MSDQRRRQERRHDSTDTPLLPHSSSPSSKAKPRRKSNEEMCRLRLKTNCHRQRSHVWGREPTRRGAWKASVLGFCRSLRTLVLLDAAWAGRGKAKGGGLCFWGMSFSGSCWSGCDVTFSTQDTGVKCGLLRSLFLRLLRDCSQYRHRSRGHDWRARFRFELGHGVRDGCHHCRSCLCLGRGRRNGTGLTAATSTLATGRRPWAVGRGGHITR